MKVINIKKKKTDDKIAGALFDFMGYLTSVPKSVNVGSSHDAGKMLDLFDKWRSNRNLDINNADVTDWDGRK